MKKFLVTSILFFVCVSAHAKSPFEKFRGMQLVYESQEELEDGNYWHFNLRDNGKITIKAYVNDDLDEKCKSNGITNIRENYLSSGNGGYYSIATSVTCKDAIDKERETRYLRIHFNFDSDPNSYQAQFIFVPLSEDGITSSRTVTIEPLDISSDI